jgi:N-carbamoylputrescine amidase
MDDINVAAVCMRSWPARIERNLGRIEFLAFRAAAEGADLVCFPELSVTGYVLQDPANVYRDTDPEKVMDRLIHLAHEAGVVIIAGLVEISAKGAPFISQIVAGPEGLIGAYRKTHLSPQEKKIYQAGREIKIFSARNLFFGVQLCYECHFPEISTTMALMGAEILFLPHASPRGTADEKMQSWLRHLPARAFDNAVFVVACNLSGKTEEGLFFPGIAMILGPDGRLVASYAGEEETILFAELKADVIQAVRKHRMRYFLPHRRPELYHALIKSGLPQHGTRRPAKGKLHR